MSNFNNLEVIEILSRLMPNNNISRMPELWVADVDQYTVDELLNDDILSPTKLEAIEAYGADNGLIESIEECEERYRGYLLECLDLERLVRLEHDEPMQSEAEGNILDNWVSDGELHSEQYLEYGMSIDYSELVKTKINM